MYLDYMLDQALGAPSTHVRADLPIRHSRYRAWGPQKYVFLNQKKRMHSNLNYICLYTNTVIKHNLLYVSIEERPTKAKVQGAHESHIWLWPLLCLSSQQQPPWLVAASFPCPGFMLVTTSILGTLLLAPATD